MLVCVCVDGKEEKEEEEEEEYEEWCRVQFPAHTETN